MMKIRLGWLALLFGLVLASSARAADEWKVYRYPQDGFSAEFPTPPEPQVQKVDPQRTVRDMQYWSDRGDIAYGIGAVLFHHKIIAGQPPDKQIQNVIEGVRGAIQCSIRSQRAISFPGATGREIVLDKCSTIAGGDVKQRIFIVGDRLFQVMVLGKVGLAESADTNRFLESFGLMAQ